MARPTTGDRINNYLLDELIGTGSFGEVWKARHHVFKHNVAIKIPTDARYVRHLQREGVAIHGLRDPHIVRALDMDPYADPPYLIMEYVEGSSLRALISANPGGLPVGTTVAVLYGVLSALEVAHAAKVIHRDVKPENVLIASEPISPSVMTRITPAQVKVTDFGLGYCGDKAMTSMMQSGSIAGEAGLRLAGTIAYMSPEQRDAHGMTGLDARSDLYSVGVVLHEMLTGILPQGSDLPGSLRAEVPRWLDRVFERCYTRRERRYQSAADIRSEIERYWPGVWSWAVTGDRHPVRVQQVAGGWQCMSCEGSVEPGDQFCINCGRQLVEHVPRCPTCHAFVGRSDNYCILCGMDLRRKA
jgi:serine/threonine protein kinase